MAQNIDASLKALSKISGFIAAAVVDTESGMTLGVIGGGDDFAIEVAAAANRDVVIAKQRAAEALGLDDAIEDILITLSSQYHLIRPMANQPTVFIYIALDKAQANLALSRRSVSETEKQLRV